MSEKYFQAETTFTMKMRIDMVRVLMGKCYPFTLLVSGAVLLYNYYLINTGRAIEGDVEKTVSLFVLMIIWAFIPVVVGFLWHKLSRVTTQRVTIFEDNVLVENNVDTFRLSPDKFYVIAKKEEYILFGSEYMPVESRKMSVIFPEKDLKQDNEEDIIRFLYDMKNKEK